MVCEDSRVFTTMSIRDYFTLLDLRDQLYRIDNERSRKAIKIINGIINIKNM